MEKDIVEMEGRVAAALRIGADGVKEAIYTVMECLWDCVSHSGPSPGNSGPAVQAARGMFGVVCILVLRLCFVVLELVFC